jgi:flagellar assembly protein FliH
VAYSLESVYKAAEESRLRREAADAAEKEELSASLRLWRPPSFDPTAADVPRAKLPTVEEVEAIRAEAHKLGLDAGYEAGFTDGQKDGFAVGHKEGTERGQQEGYEAGYAQAREEVTQLSQALGSLLAAIEELPKTLAEPMAEIALNVGERLSGQIGMDREPFVSAVHEALMRFPKPGETLVFRVCEQDKSAWQRAVLEPGLPFACSVIADETVPSGHAYAEIHGMRLNLGLEARRALVRTALGLNASAD